MFTLCFEKKDIVNMRDKPNWLQYYFNIGQYVSLDQDTTLSFMFSYKSNIL